MENITFDKRNYRRHDEKNKRVIRKSLEELGAGRSVVIDKDGTLIAGNGVYEQAQKLKMPVRVVETDGSELVVVKRNDLATGDEKRKKLALADNVASDLSDFDDDLLREDFSMEELSDWGLEFEQDDMSDVDEEGKQVWKDGEFDFAFTCPPYFDVEKYAGEETSTKRYPQFEQWCNSFYRPLIVNTMQALKDNGVFCIVVGSQLYPLAERLKQICAENGYKIERCEDKIFATNMHDTDEEKIDSLYLISKQ